VTRPTNDPLAGVPVEQPGDVGSVQRNAEFPAGAFDFDERIANR
jgi:hypothetical protein